MLLNKATISISADADDDGAVHEFDQMTNSTVGGQMLCDALADALEMGLEAVKVQLLGQFPGLTIDITVEA